MTKFCLRKKKHDKNIHIDVQFITYVESILTAIFFHQKQSNTPVSNVVTEFCQIS